MMDRIEEKEKGRELSDSQYRRKRKRERVEWWTLSKKKGEC
jgi:hypothetical protein